MSRRIETLRQAAAGELGALRWSVLMDPGDALAKLVLIMMACAANTSWECYMSIRTIAGNAGCSGRTVERKIEFLLVRGYLDDVSAQYPERRTRTYRLCAKLGLDCG